jgi:hypothetical protein
MAAMMTLDDVKQLIQKVASPDRQLEECDRVVASGEARPLQPTPGRMRVGEAIATLEIRRRTAANCGRRITGIDDTLARLRERDEAEYVWLVSS